MKPPPVNRIGAGAYKGRALRYPSVGRGAGAHEACIRPTASRTREALFNSLRDEIAGCAFVDLYAAAGGVGIEALSRGASFVHFVERDQQALAALADNLSACGVEPGRYRIHGADVVRFVAGGGLADPAVRVVFADPPYEHAADEIDSLLALVDETPYPHIRFVVVEHSGVLPARERRRWRAERSKRYGDTTLTYFTPTEGCDP